MEMKKEGYLFLHNISKKNNIGGIVRSACAFNLTKIFYVSKQDATSKKASLMKEFSFFGNKGTFGKIEFHAFNTLKDAKQYFKDNNIFVCGVEIGNGAEPVNKHPFRGNTAFFLGNEGTGLLPVHKEMCDHFVYIPQYSEKTASLNVSVAAGIIFHHFALWAQFPEAQLYGEKFKPLEYDKSQHEKGGQSDEGERVDNKQVDKEKIEDVFDLIEAFDADPPKK